MKQEMKVFIELRDALGVQFLERPELINGMLVALLSGHPLLMLGPPGTAKTAISKALCSSITSSKFFAWCMNKLTTPEELFGSISLMLLEQDRYARITTGKLPDAHVVMLDEIFKGSSAINNTLLTALNEKEFYNDGKAEKIPLKVLYAASNETPQGEELGAMFDRFVLKHQVDPVKEDSSIEALFRGGVKPQYPVVTLDDVIAIQDFIKSGAVRIDLVIKPLKDIRRAIEAEGIQVSDRKWVQIVSVLQAQALLNGNDAVTEDDLSILNHVLWMNVEQRAKVRKVVSRHANPLGEKVTEILDGAREVYNGICNSQVDSIEGFKKLKHATQKLQGLGDSTKNTLLAKAVTEVKKLQNLVAKEHLDLELGE